MIVKTNCPMCDEMASEVWKNQDVPYGQSAVILVAYVPVIECTACDGEFTDWRGERIRAAVVKAYLQGVLKQRQWESLSEHDRKVDGSHVIGWNERWGVSEFMLHDDGWTVATFNGQCIKSEPTLWHPMLNAPVKTV